MTKIAIIFSLFMVIKHIKAMIVITWLRAFQQYIG